MSCPSATATSTCFAVVVVVLSEFVTLWFITFFLLFTFGANFAYTSRFPFSVFLFLFGILN